jgi:hypothetical protein
MPRHDPLRRSQIKLQRDGYFVERLRRWRSRPKRAQGPTFGFMDLLALTPGEPPLAVRVVGWRWVTATLAELAVLPPARAWVDTGGRIEVWSWVKSGRVWDLERHDFTTEELQAVSRGAA